MASFYTERRRNEVAFVPTQDDCFSAFNGGLLNEETATADASWCIQFRAEPRKISLPGDCHLSIARPRVRACRRGFTAAAKCTHVCVIAN